MAGWGEGKAGSGQVGGDREQSLWEAGGGVIVVHPGPPHGDTGADSPAHATQTPGPGQHGQASASRGWVTSQGYLRPHLGRDSPFTISVARFNKEEREKQLGLITRN